MNDMASPDEMPDSSQFRQIISVIFVICIGVFLALISLFALRGLQEERMKTEFLDHAAGISYVFEKQINHEIQALYRLKGLFKIVPDLDLEQFQLYSNQITDFQPAIRALSWQPIIDTKKIAHYENYARSQGLDKYTVWHSKLQNPPHIDKSYLTHDGLKTKNLPVLYLSPLGPNERYLGFDILSDPDLSIIYENAIASGEAIATGRVRYDPSSKDTIGFFIALAVYNTVTPPISTADKVEHSKGVVSAAYAIETFMNDALVSLPENIELSLFDTTFENDEHIIFATDFDFYETSSQQQDPQVYDQISATGGLSYNSSFEVGGHRWEMFIRPNETYIEAHFSLTPWLVFFFILMLALLSAFYLKTLLTSRAVIATRVDEQLSVIRENERKLIQANTELEEFAYRTSHDLRAPIISSNRLLKVANDAIAENDTDMASASLTHAQKSLSRLEVLIVDLLTLTEVGNKSEDDELIDIESAIDNALSKLDNLEGFARLQINKDLQFQGQLFAKPSRFNLILENLLSNSVKYQDYDKTNPFVTIRTLQIGTIFILEVEDNGLGVPPSYREHLFKMFKRFHPRAAIGSGLGLYLMKKSANVLDGDVEFIAKENGSLFRLTLPL